LESSTLKECGKQKARGVFHPKCKSEKRKVSSLLSLHFFFSMVFFSFVFFFFSFAWKEEDAKKKVFETQGKK
jgi:hypothetical protein